MSDLIEEKENILHFKVLFLGRSGTKKTEIMTSLKSHQFSPYGWRNFSNLMGKKMFFKEENKIIKNEIGIQKTKKYIDLTRLFYKNTDIFILVYDITNYKSFEEIKNFWIKDVKEYTNKEFSKKNKNILF